MKTEELERRYWKHHPRDMGRFDPQLMRDMLNSIHERDRTIEEKDREIERLNGTIEQTLKHLEIPMPYSLAQICQDLREALAQRSGSDG